MAEMCPFFYFALIVVASCVKKRREKWLQQTQLFPKSRFLVIMIIAVQVALWIGWSNPAFADCQRAKLLASDGEEADLFGDSVDISGDTAVIGAYGDNDNGSNSGSAYIFCFNDSSWLQQAKLLTYDGAGYDYFGYFVAISGDTAVIGAFGDDDNGGDSGSAYIFGFNGSSWLQQAKLLASDGAAEDYFGFSVAISGDTAIIGAYSDDDNGYDSGSAYIFHFNGSSWLQQAKLLASDGADSDYFGFSVAISGDTA
ncbi:MAG: FG-GAP repeat protein, partial [Sedimentisphaerales bacterium]|nr:FG-GAP repeat protein [Sedimentisphaerales bacterium]